MVWSIPLSLLVLGGCARSSPESAVRAVAAAALSGAKADVVSLLGPRTRARLADDARVASEQAGRRRLAAGDLVAIGWSANFDDVETVELVERAGDHAIVEIAGRRGPRSRVEVVRERGAWLVELP